MVLSHITVFVVTEALVTKARYIRVNQPTYAIIKAPENVGVENSVIGQVVAIKSYKEIWVVRPLA